MITDYSDLNEGVEIIYDTANLTIQLIAAGNLDASDGVDGTQITRHAKRAWKDVPGRSGFSYPFDSALGGYIELINGWDWKDNTTRKLIRNIGWKVVDEATGRPTQIWAGIITKGDLGASDQPYYQQYAGGPAIDFTFTGAVNEAIQVYEDTNADGTPDYDYTDYLFIACRPWGRTFSQSSMTAENISKLSNTRHIFSLANRVDDKISATLGDMTTIEPYTSMSVTYYNSDQSKDTGDGASPYRRIVTGPASTTLQEFYEFSQYSLTLNSDIDAGAGSVTGKTADSFCAYDGDRLVTVSGVWLEAVRADEKNFVTFTDYIAATHTYPYVAAFTMKFGANATADADYKYWVYFDDPDGVADSGDEYGTSGAILINDDDSVAITGTVSGNAEIVASFDYDGNTQGGRTAGEDAQAWLIGIGTDGSFASKAFIITQSTTTQVSIDPTLDRIEAAA
jgi:hypothetical protein